MSTRVNANSRTVAPIHPANITLNDMLWLRAHKITNAMPTSADSIVRIQTTKSGNTEPNMKGMGVKVSCSTSAATAIQFILWDARVQDIAVSR